MHTLHDQSTRTVIALVLLRWAAEDASSALGHCDADVFEPGCHLLVKLGADRSTLTARACNRRSDRPAIMVGPRRSCSGSGRSARLHSRQGLPPGGVEGRAGTGVGKGLKAGAGEAVCGVGRPTHRLESYRRAHPASIEAWVR